MNFVTLFKYYCISSIHLSEDFFACGRHDVRHHPKKADTYSTPFAARAIGLTMALFAFFAQSPARAEVLVQATSYAKISAFWYSNVLEEYQSIMDEESIYFGGVASAGGFGGPSYGLLNCSATASSSTSTLSISGSADAGAGATGFGDPVDMRGQADSVANLSIQTATEVPFLFRCTAAANPAVNAGVILSGTAPVGWSGNEVVTSAAAVSGFAESLFLGGSSNCDVQLYSDGTANSNGSFTAQLEVDENVLRSLDSNFITEFASSGQVGAVVNYPTPLSYTGQTNPSSVVSIDYSTPSGSFLSGVTNISRVVHYKWNITGATERFSVRVIPGFQPADIVRVSYDGQPVQVFFEAPSLPPGTVSNVLMYPTSGSSFSVGQTPVVVSANVPDSGLPDDGLVARTFTVTIIDGSSWGTGGQGVPSEFQNDSDGDGQPAWVELAAGSSPNDPTDRFTASIQRPGDAFVISWVGAGGITYQVESISLDGSSAPVPIGSAITATGTRPLLSVTDTWALSSDRSKFYRVKVLPQ